MFLTFVGAKFEVTRRFYERLTGLTFASEQHGAGLPHHAAEQSRLLIEIYPELKTLPPKDCFFIGEYVKDPKATKAELIAEYGGQEPQPEIPTTKSGIATLRDPNGILVRLFPKPAGVE